MELSVNVYYLDTRAYTPYQNGIVKAIPFTARSTLVTWGNLPQSLIATDEIYVQKAGNNGATGWVTLKRTTMAGQPSFIDETANNTIHRHGYEWYRLAIPTIRKIVGPVNVYGAADLVGSEIAYRHRIILEKTPSGNRCFAFIRMRGGIRCPNCWDEIMQQRTRTGCSQCYDTGFYPGFYDPIAVALNLGPEQEDTAIEMVGPSNNSAVIGAWTSNYPLLSNGDVLIEPISHAVWTVMKVEPSTVQRVITKQVLTLERAQGDDTIMRLVYRLPGGDPQWRNLLQNLPPDL